MIMMAGGRFLGDRFVNLVENRLQTSGIMISAGLASQYSSPVCHSLQPSHLLLVWEFPTIVPKTVCSVAENPKCIARLL
jgi:hypothetical protein